MGRRSRRPLLMQAMDAARGRKLTPADKLVFAYMACKQGRNGQCWPGIRTIARDLGLSKNCAKECVERLCAVGLIDRTPGRPGSGHSARYSVRLDKRVTEWTFSEAGKGSEDDPLSESADTEKRVTPRPEKGHSVTQNLSRSNHKSSAQRSSCAHTQARTPKPQAKTPAQEFIPPTVEQVADYAESRGVTDFDAARFVEYYQKRGWVKVNGQPVRDWKGTVRTWIDHDNQRRMDRGEPPLDGYSQFGTHPATDEEIEALQREGVL